MISDYERVEQRITASVDDLPVISADEILRLRKLAFERRQGREEVRKKEAEDKRKLVVSIRLKRAVIEQYKQYNQKYTTLMSEILEKVLQEPDILERLL